MSAWLAGAHNSTRFAPATALPDASSSERIAHFFAERRPLTPCIVIDLEIVRARYEALRLLFPAATIFYAIKANPASEVIGALAALGANFDLASEGERQRCAGLGIAANRLSFGNTIKRGSEIAQAHAECVELYAVDALGELEKIASYAPGSGVYCRLLVDSAGAQWPLSRKFGCTPHMAVDLLCRAAQLGLRPLGVSFHVGSQQTEPRRWAGAIAKAARVFRDCARSGIALEFVNLGGGFPAQYRTPVPAMPAYAEVIEGALRQHFGSAVPRIFVEPGRYLVGDAGVLRSTVLLISRKSLRARRRWIYLDAGRFNGLPETLGEHIRYRIRTPHGDDASESAILAGPTCDSADVLYQRMPCELPVALAIGDPLDLLSTGAYTASCAAVEFNGFDPIRTYFV